MLRPELLESKTFSRLIVYSYSLTITFTVRFKHCTRRMTN